MEKVCTGCQELKGINNYYWENARQRYQNICKSCIKVKSRIRYTQKKDIICVKNKEWINNNKDKFKSLVKKNRSNYKEYDQEYAKKNWIKLKNDPNYQSKHREYQKEYKRQKRQNPEYRLKENLRTYFYKTITRKTNSVFEYLGCSTKEFKVYLEKQFDANMNWENYGSYWEIDHIKSIETFNFLNETEIHECWNYKNLQPLTINENRTKRYKKYGYTSKY